MQQQYDYIIVGAGSAGCVIANKLSADPRHNVLLLEAGPPDTHPMIHMPKGFTKIAASKQHALYYDVEPGASGKNTAEIWLRGKMLGGSSSINGLQYQRGHAEDYNHWERDLGLAGWGWKDFLRIYREMEDHELGANEFRGAGGPLPITVSKNRTMLMDKVIEAGGEMGLRHLEDANDPDHEGIGYIHSVIKDGRRYSAAKAFLSPVKGRPNLRIVTGADVQRILFEGTRAVGVECISDGKTTQYRASREVILSAGALHSPKLLQLSGIGPVAHLASLGIPVLHDSPNVGANMREHLIFTIQFRLTGDYSQNPEYSGWRLYKHALQYMLFHSGLLAQSPYDVTAFVRTRPGSTRPDAQLVTGPISMDFAAWEGFDKGVKLEDLPGAQMLGYGTMPKSQGSLMIRSKDPRENPKLIHNHLTHEDDKAVAIGTVRFIRRLFDQPTIKPYISGEMVPGPKVHSDEAILDEYNRMSGPGYHTAGTCSMGNSADSVVDERLRVRGVTGLRVADLSVFPTLVTGNTNGPVMAAGWRASELILEDAVR